MSMKRNITIDGQEVALRPPPLFPGSTMRFHRDIYKDLRDLEKGIDKNDQENSNLDLFSLEMFENIAYVMAKHADPSIPDTPEEWLDGFNTFSIYQVLPQIIELWGLNTQTDVQAKKNFVRLTGNDNALISPAVRAAGLSIRDLDLLTIGMVNDMYVESRNDEHKYAVVATQEDFDKF